MDEERRKDLRFRCTGHADVRPGVDAPTLPGRIVDVSAGGCLIELVASQKIVPNETVELTFSINRLPFRVRGEVTSIRSGPAVGFKFTRLSERVQERLEELIEELAEDWRKRFAEHRWYAEDFVRRDAEEMIKTFLDVRATHSGLSTNHPAPKDKANDASDVETHLHADGLTIFDY